MDNKFTNQEEQLRELTENFSLEIDTAALWDKVESQLPPVQDERKRPVIWWFVSGTLMAIIGLLMWNNISASEQNQSLEDLPSNNLIALEAQNDFQNTNQTKEIASTPLYASNTAPTEIIPTSKTTLNPTSNTTLKTISKTITNENTQTPTTESLKENSSAKTNTDRYDEKSESLNTVVINQSSIANKTIDALIDPSVFTNQEPSVDLDLIAERSIITGNLLNTIEPKLLEYNSNFNLPLLEVTPLKKTNWLPYLALSGGVNMNSSDIYTNSTENFDLSQFENEKSLLGLSSAFRIGLENNNGWRFGIGINHSRLVTRYSQNEPVLDERTISGTSFSKIDEFGNVTSEDGLLLETTVTNYDVNWHRNHDYVYAQLNIGKRIYQIGRFSSIVDMTFARNIWSRHTGYYFNEGEKTINKFEGGSENPYSNSGYDLGLSIDLEYRLNQFSVGLTTFASKGLNSTIQSSNYYQLKNSQYGIQLGIVYRP